MNSIEVLKNCHVSFNWAHQEYTGIVLFAYFTGKFQSRVIIQYDSTGIIRDYNLNNIDLKIISQNATPFRG